jgi:hypothetical protein
MTMSIEALHPGPTSSEVIRDIFDMHFYHYTTAPFEVLDLTYGKGTFWNWDYATTFPNMVLFKNDLYVENWDDPNMFNGDFTKTDFPDKSFDIVVFDPPFSAHGPPSDGQAHMARYGSDRSQGGPQNINDVQTLLYHGIREAKRLSKYGIIMKTQSVIESGNYFPAQGHAEFVLTSDFEEKYNRDHFKIVDELFFLKSRRPQPDAARGAKVRHFRNRPSIFIVGKRK